MYHLSLFGLENDFITINESELISGHLFDKLFRIDVILQLLDLAAANFLILNLLTQLFLLRLILFIPHGKLLTSAEQYNQQYGYNSGDRDNACQITSVRLLFSDSFFSCPL